MKKLLPSLLIALLLIPAVPVNAAKTDELIILSASVSNISIPTPNIRVDAYVHTVKRPDTDATYYSIAHEDCFWSDESRTRMEDNATFAEGKIYYYSIALKTNGSYAFSSEASLLISGGDPAAWMQRIIQNGGKEIIFQNAYKVMCGEKAAQPEVASVTLSKDTFYYDGKVHKPKSSDITVLDQYGNQVSQSDYTVEYSGKCKKVGVYTLTVTGKDLANSTASTTFTINPSTPRSVRVAGGSGSVKVKWSKPKSGKPDYYDVFVYKDSACKEIFTSARLAKTSKTIVGLRSGMTYYIKVDCFVRSDAGYLVSKPSGAKSVTVR